MQLSEESWSTTESDAQYHKTKNLLPSKCTEQRLFLTKFAITEIERSSWHTDFLFWNQHTMMRTNSLMRSEREFPRAHGIIWNTTVTTQVTSRTQLESKNFPQCSSSAFVLFSHFSWAVTGYWVFTSNWECHTSVISSQDSFSVLGFKCLRHFRQVSWSRNGATLEIYQCVLTVSIHGHIQTS